MLIYSVFCKVCKSAYHDSALSNVTFIKQIWAYLIYNGKE